MDWYGIVKRNYNAGFYTNDQVKVFVSSGKITATQYEEITGEPYVV